MFRKLCIKKIIKGVGVALVTPFTESGEVDFEALDRLVDSVVAGGVDFLVAMGTTAETPTLTHEERCAVAEAIVKRNAGRVPVVIGMGGNDTAKLCEQLRAFDPTGFAAVLSVTPYYNKPTQEGLYRHFGAVAEASPLPVILYNVPSRTGVNMSAATTLRIARECPNVCAVKEACGNIRQMEEIVAGAPEGFSVLSGDDALTLPLISVGGDGIISVIANAFAARFSTMVHTAIGDSVARGEELWEDLAEVCPMLFEEGNPAGIKAALAAKGICRADVRLPLVEASPALMERISKAIVDNKL
jgi:4-hydroxy-tetrahydrodipicolinate synthase